MKLFPDIKPKEASKKLEIEYTKSFCNSFYLIKNKPLNTTKTPKKTITLGQGKPSTTSFIDDPDELLLSVAIRELNRENPDPRWASILINCKKEKITTQRADIEQFKQLPTKALVSLLSKSSQEKY